MSADRRKRSDIVDGLAKGLEKVDVPGMACAIGEGLVRVSEAWLPKQKLAIPQHCGILGCRAGPYISLPSLSHHITIAHAELTVRERSFALDRVRRQAVRQVMNGAPRSP